MTTYIYDLEWKVKEDGDPVRDAEKIWCAVFKEVGKDNWHEFYGTTITEIPMFLLKPDLTLIAHNQLGADLHILRRFLDIDFTVMPDTIMGMPCTFIDTYSWSTRLWPDRPAPKGCKGSHGLDPWGVRNGIPKPPVTDWSDQPIEVYLHRCREDVINNEVTYFKLLQERGR